MNKAGARLQIDESNDVTVVAFHGRLDLEGVDEVEEAFRAAAPGARRLVIDLNEVDYVSSSAIRMFLSKARKIRSDGGQLALCRLQPLVHNVFQATKLFQILPIVTTRDEAVEQLRRVVS